MKLAIISNFVFPSVGGSEVVCKEIAESMANTYKMDVTTFGFNVEKKMRRNGVAYRRCTKGKDFIEQIQEFDCLFLYSDSLWCFRDLLENIEIVKPKIVIALLGMYEMFEHKDLFEKFKKYQDKFKVVVHSKNYQDYKKCFQEKIPVFVIPNGANVEEFDIKKEIVNNFRTKYGISERDRILLNVSNYFYGKSQNSLALVGEKLARIRKPKDFTIVQISKTVKYPYDKMFMEKAKREFETKGKPNSFNKNKGFKYAFLRDIPRVDVVAAFLNADVFVSTSLKEVFPLTILEASCVEVPWVSQNVGCVSDLKGGVIIDNPNTDKKGYKVFDDRIASRYADCINNLLNDGQVASELGLQGYNMVESVYNWKDICERYYNLFIL
jgi:glycosyltransferase involved in cell wall biosynthesis